MSKVNLLKNLSKFWKSLKKILQIMKEYDGVIGVIVAAWALWFSYSNSHEQNDYNRLLYNNIDSLRILTSRMLERQILSEKADVIALGFTSVLKPTATDSVNIFPLAGFSLENNGFATAIVEKCEMKIHSSRSTLVYTTTLEGSFEIPGNNRIPVEFCYAAPKYDEIVSYIYIRCIFSDNKTNIRDTMETMRTFTYIPENNSFLVTLLRDSEINETLEIFKKYHETKMNSDWRNIYYRERTNLKL